MQRRVLPFTVSITFQPAVYMEMVNGNGKMDIIWSQQTGFVQGLEPVLESNALHIDE